MAGPDLKKTSFIPIGMADILVGPSLSNIDSTDPVLTHALHGLGVMGNTTLNTEVTVFEVKGGNPQTTQEIIPTGETFGITAEFQEQTLRNIEFSRGLVPSDSALNTNGSGEIPLGSILAPSDIRVEFVRLFPDGSNMTGILPRCQVTPNTTIGSSPDSPNGIEVTVNALPANADAPDSKGSAAWDSKPLGALRIKL